MASNPITKTNVLNYIPEIWSKEVLADVEKKLLTAKLVDRSYEAFMKEGGYILHVPHLAEISANAVNTAADMTLYDAVQNTTQINVNISYDIGVAVDDINKVQTNPKYFTLVRSKMAYGLAKQIDINVNALFNGFSQTVGTEGSALTSDVLIEAYEYLNLADAPEEERAWVFDPESITDLLKIDYFVKMDYVPGSVSEKGFVGRQIFGAPVYITTNLEEVNTSYHGATFMQKEAIALIIQMQPKFETFRLGMRHSDVISGLCTYGVCEMRDTFGVFIKTRS